MTTDVSGLPPIPRVTLGRTGIQTSKLALGTWGWGNAGPAEARVENEQMLVEVLKTAFAAGIRYIDTAELYQNEAQIGKALPETNPPPDLTIATKFGRSVFTADAFRAHAERSLRDLGQERLPLLLVHDPRNEDDMKAVLGPGGALEGIRKLQSEGLIGYTGIGTSTLRPLQIAIESGEFDVIQFPMVYTLLNPSMKSSGLMAAAKAKNLGTILAAPFAGNILATGAVDGALYRFRPAHPEIVEAVRRMEARCAELGVKIAEAALAHSYTEPLIDVTLAGMKSPQEIRWNVAPFASKLSRADVESIAEASKLDLRLIGGPDFLSHHPPES